MPQKENMDNKLNYSLKIIFKTSIIVLIGILFSKIFTYAYRIIIARYYGPEVYGLFSLAVMISGGFIAFSALGLSEGLLRFISLYRGKKELNKIKHIFKISLLILSSLSILSGIILFLSSEFISITIFHNVGLIPFLKIFSFVIPFTVLSYPFLASLRAYEKIGWYSFLFNIFQNFVKLLLLIVLVILGFRNDAVPLSYTTGVLALLIFSYLVCKYKIPILFTERLISKKQKDSITKELFYYSFPLFLSSIMSLFFVWIDSFSIGYFKSAIDVGFYNAAVPIALLLTIVPELFMQLFFPLITKEYAKKNFYLIKQLSQQVGKWIFIILLPATILLFLFPGAALNILFGNNYLIAETSLRFLTIGIFFYSLFVIFSNLISMVGKSKILLVNTIILSIFNIFLNILLVPKYGINGAAFSTMFCYILFGILLLFETRHYLSIIPIKRKMLRILLISVIPTALLIFIKPYFLINIFNLILLTVLFLIVYIILMFVTRCFDNNDLMILSAIKEKIIK